MKKKCDMARLFKAALKAGRAVALALCVVAALAGCATTGGAASASRQAADEDSWNQVEVDEYGWLWVAVDSGYALGTLSVVKLDLLLYTLGDFFMQCRETGMEKALVKGGADAVVFAGPNGPYATRFFRLGWDACAEYGVDTVESEGMLKNIAREVLTNYSTDEDYPGRWYNSPVAQTRVEIKLLAMALPLIWRDDLDSFFNEYVTIWGYNSQAALARRFQRSSSWEDRGYALPSWLNSWPWVQVEAEGSTTEVPAEWKAPADEELQAWYDADYYRSNSSKHNASMFSAVADFLLEWREKGLANADVNKIVLEGREGRITTEYFRAGAALIRDGKDGDTGALVTALDKLYFETLARAGVSYYLDWEGNEVESDWEWGGWQWEELDSLKIVLGILAEGDSWEGIAKEFLLCVYSWCSPRDFKLVEAKFPEAAAW